MTEDDEGKYFEIWINSQDGKYCLVENQPITVPVVSLGFSDVDRDSVIDMVFVEQDDNTSPKIHIIYNRFPGNDPENPCSGDLAFLPPYARDQDVDVYNGQEISAVIIHKNTDINSMFSSRQFTN